MVLTRQWYDKLLSGEKEEDYRDIKPYYTSRLRKLLGEDKFNLLKDGKELLLGDVIFRNGYGKDCRSEYNGHVHVSCEKCKTSLME